MGKGLDKDHINTVMEMNLKENGRMTKSKLANTYSAREINLKGGLKMVKWPLGL